MTPAAARRLRRAARETPPKMPNIDDLAAGTVWRLTADCGSVVYYTSIGKVLYMHSPYWSQWPTIVLLFIEVGRPAGWAIQMNVDPSQLANLAKSYKVEQIEEQSAVSSPT